MVTTKRPVESASTVTPPSRSVRYTRAATSLQSSTTRPPGWPYSLRAPTEITATSGLVASAHSSVVPFQLPWCATLSTRTGGMESCASQYFSSSCSESPVNRARNVPYSTNRPTDQLFCCS